VPQVSTGTLERLLRREGERASGLSGATLPEFLRAKRRRSNWRSTERVKFDYPFSRKNGQLAARELGLQLHSMEVSNADPF